VLVLLGAVAALAAPATGAGGRAPAKPAAGELRKALRATEPAVRTTAVRPRVFISTDMQIVAGYDDADGDKDDVQSLVHALMYQDRINIVGIASSTSRHQPGANDEKFIHRTIDAYALDQPKLAPHGRPGDFKSAGQLHALTHQGTKTVVRTPRLLRPVKRVFSWAARWGYPDATPASDAIVTEARAAAAAGEKLYVVTWGGMGDVARALKDAPKIAGVVRLISIAGSLQEPNAYTFVRENFAGRQGFWWIDVNDTLKGLYSGETSRLPPAVTLDRVADFARGHGNLGDFFYENSKDLRGTGDTYGGLKMGDSPTILYLIDGGNDDDPTAESWGGAYRQVGPNYWTDRTDAASSLRYKDSRGARTIYRHRSAWLGDFMARFDWLLEAPFGESDATDRAAPRRL
jgi:hypothetical protein